MTSAAELIMDAFKAIYEHSSATAAEEGFKYADGTATVQRAQSGWAVPNVNTVRP